MSRRNIGAYFYQWKDATESYELKLHNLVKMKIIDLYKGTLR